MLIKWNFYKKETKYLRINNNITFTVVFCCFFFNFSFIISLYNYESTAAEYNKNLVNLQYKMVLKILLYFSFTVFSKIIQDFL